MKEEKELKVYYENALEAYEKGTKEQKQLLKKLFPKEKFSKDVKERVTDYASACDELGIKPLTIHSFTFLEEEDQEPAFARHQISIVAKALREGWKPDFKDGKSKYYGYKYWDSSKSGFSSGVDCDGDYCGVGSDLLFPTYELAEYALSILDKQYSTYLIS